METIKLNDIVEIYLGVTHTPTYVKEGVPFLSVKDISGGEINFDKCKYITEEEYSSLSRGARPQIGDMLFCRVGTLGKPIIVGANIPQFGSFVSLGFLRNKNDDTCKLEYIKHWMNSQSFWNQVRRNVKGASQANLNTGWLKKFDVPLPGLNEQEYIYKLLDKIKSVISLKQAQLLEYDQLIKSRFVEMFGDPITNPKKWKEMTLLDVCNKLNDGTHHSPVNSSHGDIKYITAKNIRKSGIDLSKISYVSQKDHKNIYSRCNPELGDVLYIKDGATTGIAAINTLDEEFSLLSSVALLKQNRLIIDGYYLCVFLNSDEMYKKIRMNMGGAAITRLTISKLKAIKLFVPPLKLQNQFAEIVKQVDKLKFEVQKSLDETQVLFDSLMQVYFG